MADIKWIKLDVNIFDDEKIKIIKSMPEGDKILLIWIQLLCLAGKTNDGGSIYIGQNMYYTYEMLSTIFGQPLNIVRMALKTFEQFNMLEIDNDGVLYIENWEKHQNVEGMDKIREQTRKRVAKYRERKALEDSNVTVTLRNATDKNKNKNKNKISSSQFDYIISEWNSLDENISNIQSINQGTTRYKLLKARENEYGKDKIIEAIRRINNSSFLKGYEKSWKITFDWFIKPNNFIKVLEGNYSDEKKKPKSNTNNNIQQHEDLEQKRQVEIIKQRMKRKIPIKHKN